jgi:hypothetical protein
MSKFHSIGVTFLLGAMTAMYLMSKVQSAGWSKGTLGKEFDVRLPLETVATIERVWKHHISSLPKEKANPANYLVRIRRIPAGLMISFYGSSTKTQTLEFGTKTSTTVNREYIVDPKSGKILPSRVKG